jgi:transcriptional regulator with XRE-family HTH domain
MTGQIDSHRRRTADAVRELIAATGLRLAELAEATNYSKQSWSAFQRGERPIPVEALEALIAVADGAAPALIQRARMLMTAGDQTPPTEQHEQREQPEHAVAAPPEERSVTRRQAALGVLLGLLLLGLLGAAGAAGHRLGHGTATAPPVAGGTAAGTPTRLCAHVVRQPAGVFPRPDHRTRPIKYKYAGDRVELAGRPQAHGWVAVRTPRDHPGVNWMPAQVLTAPAPCTPA